jgi:hypothetical protein
MHNTTLQFVLSGVLLLTLVFLSDPFMYWMPPKGAMVVLIVAAVLAGFFAGVVLREGASDEREALHRMYAGRVAYLLGIGVLTTALLVQGFSHTIDPWISTTLGLMIIAKLVARFYLDRYR